MDQPEDDDRLVTAFFLNVFVQLLAHLQYWFDWITSPFRFRRNAGEGFQPRNIINNLIENFGSEEIKLIQNNETAEEAFERKIRERDYVSAMKLAKKFDFDDELIYENMWEKEKKDIGNTYDEIRKCSPHKSTSFVLQQNIYRGEIMLASGEVELACLNTEMRPRRLPDEIRNLILQELEQD